MQREYVTAYEQINSQDMSGDVLKVINFLTSLTNTLKLQYPEAHTFQIKFEPNPEYPGEDEIFMTFKRYELSTSSESITPKNPIWIEVDNGEMFSGHQGHWADCFFSNAAMENIMHSLKNDSDFAGMSWTIREMTDAEVAQYPESLKFREWLIATYGTA